jgi:hypothetical protein
MSQRPLGRLLVMLGLLLGGTAGPLLSVPSVAAQEPERYDLAATRLPPETFEIEDPGEGFGLNSGRPFPVEELVATEFEGDRSLEADFEETGWLGSHLHQCWVLASADPEEIATGYSLLVSQFEDADGAEAAYELFANDDDLVETDLELGDATRIAEVTVPAGGPVDRDTQALQLTFLTDDVVALIQIGNVTVDELPDVEQFEPVAEALLERIEAVRAGEGPGLGALVQQVEFAGQAPTLGYYRRLDGVTTRRASETEEAAISLTGEEAEHVYFHQQGGPSPDAAGGDLLYIVYLYAFGDADAAEAFVEDAEDFLLESRRVEEAQTVDLDDPVGDSAVGVEFSGATSAGRPYVATGIFAQVENLVARVSISSLDGDEAPPLGPVEALAGGQVACLEAGECPDIVSLADALSGDLDASADDDPTADDDTDRDEPSADDDTSDDDTRDDDATDRTGGDEVYESPTYGYTISWDGDVWELEDESSRRGEDLLVLTGEPGTVRFLGTEAYSLPDDCLEGAVEELLDDPEFEDFTQAGAGEDEPYEGEGLLGPYTGYTDGETGVHLECVALPDGDGVLLVTFITPLADFADTFPLFVELLEGVEL